MVSNPCPCRIIPEAFQKPDALAVQQDITAYSDCCQPLHQGIKKAQDSETLMRSRYTAFVKVLPDYIIQTTLTAQQSGLDRQAITEWAEQTDWAGLQIINHSPKVSKRHAQVEFKAFHNNLQLGAQSLEAHHELSTFVQVKLNNKAATQDNQNYRWYFLDPTTSIQLSQKQPCICGSGQKFKRCCGQFL